MTYIRTRKGVNFSNKVNELFPLLSRSNEITDLILVENLCEDDQIKSAVDKAAKHLQCHLRIYQLSFFLDPPFYWNEHA